MYVWVDIYIHTHNVWVYIYIYIHTHTHTQTHTCITLFGITEPKVLLPPCIFVFSMTHTTNGDCLLSCFGANTLRLDYKHQSGNAEVIAVCLEGYMKHINSKCE
jgi:hypothetical protein